MKNYQKPKAVFYTETVDMLATSNLDNTLIDNLDWDGNV